METLGGSYLKFFVSSKREKERIVWSSREIALSRQEIGFLLHQKRVRVGLSLAVSFRPKCIRSVSAVSSAQTNVESEEIRTISLDQPKTVHVRFKLHKECAFGQHFLVVGNDPILGLWDPSDGVPLNWSEGHVWTAEMDLPCGKVIKYKFILEGNTGAISWQPGTDRVLETWDTEKIISVTEDWDNPKLQNIVVEEFVADKNEESLINSDLSLVAENLNNQTIVGEGNDAIKELANTNNATNHSDKPAATMVAENISEELGEQDLSSSDKGSGLMSVTDKKQEKTTLGNNGGVANGSSLSNVKDETRLVLDEEAPVLVPGLVPVPPEEIEAEEEVIQVENKIEAEEVNQVANNIVENTTTESEEIQDSAELELKDEHVSASLHYTETSEMKIDEKQPVYGEERLESNVLESDMQWGRRTLQKFLANLGFI